MGQPGLRTPSHWRGTASAQADVSHRGGYGEPVPHDGWVKPSSVVVLILVIVVFAVAGARLVSWKSAESGCTIRAEQLGGSSVSYEWSSWPPGTTCTFDGGYSETRLLW